MPLNPYDAFLQANPLPAAEANPYDDNVRSQAQAEQVQLRGSMFAASRTAPDRAAQIIKLSERAKIPVPVVERNFDELSKKFDLTDDEYGSIIRNNPTLTTWLGNPENAAVSRDDLPTLQRIENTLMSWVRGWTRAESGGELSDLEFRDVEQGRLSPSDIARRDTLGNQLEQFAREDQANGLPEYLAGTAGYSVRQLGGSIYAALQGIGYGGVAGIALGAPTGLGAVATGTAGAIAGGLTARAQYIYRMETGFAWRDFRQMRDINGNTIDPAIARNVARGVGAVNAVIEEGSDVLLATLVPGFGTLVKGLSGEAAKTAIRQAAKQALAIPTRRAMLASAIGKIGTMASIEGLEEFVQALVGSAGREVAQSVSGQEFRPDSFTADLADASRQALDASVGTFFAFAPVGGAHYYVGARRAAQAQQQAAFFQALGADVKDSKTFGRLPQKMQDFIEQATRDGPIETAYVDPAAFVTYFQNQGVDPRVAAEEIIGDATQYDHALLSGEQIEIPMARYATKIAPTEANAYFANELRLAPDAMNAREATEWEARQAEEAKAALAAAPAEEQNAIKEQIRQQLIDAGTEPTTAETLAQAFAATAIALAARSGQTPEQMLAPYGLKITRPSLQEQMPAGQTVMPQTRANFAEQMRAKQFVLDEGIVDQAGVPIAVNDDGTVTIYHRTTKEAAQQIRDTGRFKSLENTDETFFSNAPTGQAEGYGDAVVAVRVPAQWVRINDAFPHEIHVAVSNRKLSKENIAPSAMEQGGVRVFHGTAVTGRSGQGFRAFDKSMLGTTTGTADSKHGFWFSTNRDRAVEAASDAKELAASDGISAEVFEAVVTLKNPMIVPTIKGLTTQESAAIATRAKKAGHDGVIFTEGERGGSDYLVFDTSRISSAYEQTQPLQTTNITAEIVPSKSLQIGARLEALSFEEKQQFQREALAVIVENGVNELALRSGLTTATIAEGVGGYEGQRNPNLITAVTLDAPYHSLAQYARGWQMIYQQDGVPWFKADETMDIANLAPGQALGFFINFAQPLDNDDEVAFFAKLRNELGDAAGYTKLDDRRIAVINFRDSESNQPFGSTDAEFDAAVHRVFLVTNGQELVRYGAQTEYLYHDFAADPGGQGLESEALDQGGPDWASWLRGRREAFNAIAARWAERAQQRTLYQGDTIDGLTGEVVPNPPFYSELVRKIEAAQIDKAPAAQWQAYINGLTSKGVKKAEIAVSGVMDWLDIRAANARGEQYEVLNDKGQILAVGDATVGERYREELVGTALTVRKREELRTPQGDGRVSRQEVLDYLAKYHIRVEQKILGEPRSTQVTAPIAAAGLPEGYRIEPSDDGSTFTVFGPDDDELVTYDTFERAIEGAIGHYNENTVSDEEVEQRAHEMWEEQLPEEAREVVLDDEWVHQSFDVYFRPPSFKLVELPADRYRERPAWGVRKLEFENLPPPMKDDDSSSQRRAEGMPDDLDEFAEIWPEGPTESWATDKEFTSDAEARDWAESQEDANGFAWHDHDPTWATRDPEDSSGGVDDHESWDDVTSAHDERIHSRFESEVDSYIENASFEDTDHNYYLNEARHILEGERDIQAPRRALVRPDPNQPKYPVRYLGEQQSLGGRDYREIVLYVPGIEPYNASDTYHYGIEGEGRTVVWGRYKIQDDNAGVSTLWIEEDQSQRGQHGLKHGFKKTPTPEQLKELRELRKDLQKARDTYDEAKSSAIKAGLEWTVELPAYIEALGVIARAEDRYNLADQQYMGGTVPPAPFVTDTQAWAALGMASMLRAAVDAGIHQVAWTTGAENAVRYGLREHIDSLKWEKVQGGINVTGVKDGRNVLDRYLAQSEIAAHIGHRVEVQIYNDPSQSNEIAADQLDDINGLGMLAFYGDSHGLNQMGQPAIMTIATNKVLKVIGKNRVETIDITVEEKNQRFTGAPGFKITPDMAAKVRSGLPMFYQQSGGAKRGRIRFGLDRKFYIDLLEGENLSTFIHESGHFWLEVFGDLVGDFKTRDPATLDDRQKRMVADYDTLLKWLGAPSRGEITEAQHEQFAHGIEKYFMLGQAPSAELRTVFARVRAWMLSIYRSLRALRVSISPEVKDVFDRMMATDEQIAAAESEAEIVPLFEDEQKFIAAGFDQAFVDAYRDQMRKARDVAEQQLQTKLMATLTREREAWFKTERIRVRNEVAAEVNGRWEQIALSVLTSGQMPDGSAPEIEGRIKLNRGEIDALGGEDAWKRVPRGTTARDGLPLQAAAELFGYASGDELVKALQAVRPANRVIDEAADARMREEHGDLLVDGRIVDAARAAVQNEERGKVIEVELRALGRLRAQAAPAVALQARRATQDRQAVLGALQGSIPPLAVVRQAAAGRISATRVRDIKPMQFWHAARRASQEAKIAAGKQDYQGAIAGKQRELLNLELYRVAVAAQEEVAKIAEYMQRFSDNKVRARIAKAGQDYLDQIDGFLDRYDFAHISLKALDRRKNLAAWVAEKERLGEPVDLPDEVQAETRINYKDMTIEELRGVNDSVKHIEHLARLKNRLLTAKRTRDLQAAIDELDESLRANVRKPRGLPIETRLPKDEALRAIDTWFAMHRKLSEFAREMDGWKDGGLAWEYFVRPVNEAGDAETTMNHDAAAKLRELFGLYQGSEVAALYTKQDIPALGHPLTRMAQIMVALNWGNLDSRQKLMDGRGWNEQQVEAILARLDKRDWRFVQGMFDFINSYWPQIEAKEKRVSGIAPKKVLAAPIATQFGEMAGGYFPMKYDDRLSPRAYGHRIAEVADQMMKGAFTRATTRRGHTHERVQGVNMKVRLDFGVITEHVAQVIHDLTHHEMLIDMNRLLGSKQIAGTIIELHGDVVYKQMQEIIRDVATGQIPAIGAFEQFLNYVRTGMTISALGWNVFTSLLQPFGLTQSMTRVGPKWIAQGIGRWVGDAAHMENTAAWIKAKSPMMTDRADTQLREINEIMNEIGLHSGKLSGWIDEALRKTTFDTIHKQAIVDSFFWLIYKGQQIADIPTWLGAYEKAMADATNDEARAIAMADQAVLDSQGGGMIKDLAGIQRGGPLLKIWTSFYSYFNVTWNRNVEAVGRTHFRNPVEVGRLAVDMLLINILPASLGWITKQALTGDADDWDEWVTKLIQANLSYMLGLMIGLREFGSAIQGYAGYEGPAGVRFFSSITKLVKQTAQGEMDRAWWRAFWEGAGILFHFPGAQVRRTIEGFNAMMEGETHNPLALLVGPRKE